MFGSMTLFGNEGVLEVVVGEVDFKVKPTMLKPVLLDWVILPYLVMMVDQKGGGGHMNFKVILRNMMPYSKNILEPGVKMGINI